MNNKKNITFRITNDTFSLCNGFIEDTKFDILHKDDPDLTKLISPITTEAITIRECHSKAFLTGNILQREKIMLNVVLYVNRFYLYDKNYLSGIYRIILFFSNCYENHYQCMDIHKISYDTLFSDLDIVRRDKIFAAYDVLYLWLFFSLKDALEIDERIIHILDHHNNKTIKSFQDIVENMYTYFLQLYEALSLYTKEQQIVNGAYQMLLEIGRRININKINNKNFIVNLRNYDEFDYFINKNINPREGVLTHLRFL